MLLYTFRFAEKYPDDQLRLRILAAFAEFGPGILTNESIGIWGPPAGTPEHSDIMIYLGTQEDPDSIGADICISEADPRKIWAGIMAVASGLSKTVDPKLTADARGLEAAVMPSPREREVLELLADGETNKAAADMLHLSISTVKFHIRNLMDKTGTASRAELVAESIRRGWIGI